MSERGFTLIELMVTVSIVAILAAIGMSQFWVYKENAQNATAKSDLRNAITAQESGYINNLAYSSCTDPTDCESQLEGFVASRIDGSTLAMDTFTFTSTGQTFTATSKHRSSPTTFTYDSTSGVISGS